MYAEVKEQATIDRNLAAIYEVREKRDLLKKCERKMQMASLDRDEVRILEAARRRLNAEINALCWRIGL